MMANTTNHCRGILMILLLTFPSVLRGDEAHAFTKHFRIAWSVMPQFDLNLPGNWKSLRPYEKSNISYGGGTGGGCRILFNSDWLIDAGLSICYDNLHISESEISAGTISLERWSAPLAISFGHQSHIHI